MAKIPNTREKNQFEACRKEKSSDVSRETLDFALVYGRMLLSFLFYDDSLFVL